VASNRRLAAIMFTDMVGYTAATQADERATLALRNEQEELIRPLLLQNQGRKVKSTGDGSLVEFDSALKATECAISIQRRCNERNAERERSPLQLRIGIHLGDVEQQGDDIFGDAVNIASRIESVAEPGGICLSGAVFEQVRNKIPETLERLAPTTLKGVQAPIEIYRVVLPWLDRAPSTGTSGPTRLAVLPFANISPDPKDEYFADGMTEEMISALSKVAGLRVISRTSVMKFKGGGKTISEIGRELKLDTVLEGSVRKARNSLRITVQLIDVRTDEHLWSEDFDRGFEDVFEIQSEIAGRVAQALSLRLHATERAEGIPKPTGDLEAYTLYLRGRQQWNRLNVDGFEAALRYYQLALGRDPNYALAYAGLADCYWSMGYFHFLREGEAYPKAKGFAIQALDRDETLAEAHASLAVTLYQFEWKPAEAEREFRRAIQLNPSLALGHLNYASYLVQLGRPEEGVVEVRRAIELDPLSVLINTMAGYTLNRAHQPEKALERLKVALDLDPGFPLTHNDLGWVYSSMGRIEESIQAFRKAVDLSGGSPFFRSNLAFGYALAGQREQALAILQSLEAESHRRYVSAYFLARVYAKLGELDKAFELLEKATRESSIHWNALTILTTASDLENLRADPRFPELMRKLTPKN
jgi:adenylate cyclase